MQEQRLIEQALPPETQLTGSYGVTVGDALGSRNYRQFASLSERIRDRMCSEQW
jgi:hypothetical protein